MKLSDFEKQKYVNIPNAQDPKNLVKALLLHVDNPKIDDTQFREFVRRTLPMYQQERDVEHIEIK